MNSQPRRQAARHARLQLVQRRQQARLLALAPPPGCLVAPPNLLQLQEAAGLVGRRLIVWNTGERADSLSQSALRQAAIASQPVHARQSAVWKWWAEKRSGSGCAGGCSLQTPILTTCWRPCSDAARLASSRAAASITGSFGGSGATCGRIEGRGTGEGHHRQQQEAGCCWGLATKGSLFQRSRRGLKRDD